MIDDEQRIVVDRLLDDVTAAGKTSSSAKSSASRLTPTANWRPTTPGGSSGTLAAQNSTYRLRPNPN